MYSGSLKRNNVSCSNSVEKSKQDQMKRLALSLALLLTFIVLKAQDQFTNFGNFQTFSGNHITFFGSFVNNGTFTDGGDSVSFRGASNHNISSSSAITINNLVIDAALNGISLQYDLNVGGTLKLTAGPIRLNSRTLVINNNAASAITRTTGYIVSEQTNNSGKVKWNIGTNTTAHTFPFGTSAGAYIPLTVQVTAGDIGNITASTYTTSADNTPYPTTPVAVTNMLGAGGDNSANTVDRFWQIDKDGPSGTVNVSFTASAAEVGTITSLVAQRWNSTTGWWDAPLPGQTSSATGASVTGVTEFSPWTLSGNNVILPVELTSFSARAVEHTVELNWQTASEINNDFFTVQRSHDGTNFTDLATIKGAGTSNEAHQYKYTDHLPLDGKSYYRLKQTDFDRAEDFSDVRMVEITSSDLLKISAYPNPVSNARFTVEFESALEDEAIITLYNILGKAVYIDVVRSNRNTYDISLPNHPSPGVYVLKVSSGVQSDEQTVIIR
jgi:hypothetical protein